MKLSRLTLILGLAAALGLSVTASQVFCQSSQNAFARSAEQTGSPSYQAAQNYDDYDCFYAGCHADYGDVLPELNKGDANATSAPLPSAGNTDVDLPGDDPKDRSIPANTTSHASPDANYEFARTEADAQKIPPRGYFAPGYPHPGYQHPSYGYSMAGEVLSAQGESGAWFPADLETIAEIDEEFAVELTEQEVEEKEASAETLADDASSLPLLEEALAEEATLEDIAVESDAIAEYDLYQNEYDYGYGDSYEYETAENSAEEETSVKDYDEYTTYDDAYGYESEWYGPYDATLVRRAEDSAARTLVEEPLIEEVDPAPSEESLAEAEVGLPPEPEESLADFSGDDFGPAELEVDLKAIEAAKNDQDEEDAKWEVAVREVRDDWFYRETYGYGPRYDYDLYGCEDFTLAVRSADKAAEPEFTDSSEIAWEQLTSDASSWDTVYQWELGGVQVGENSASASPQIPFARARQMAKLGPLKLSSVSKNNAHAAEPTEAEVDPSLPVSTDFEPTAWMLRAKSFAQNLSGAEVLSGLHRAITQLTPMELARTALAAAPDCSRPARSVLVPKQPVAASQWTDFEADPASSLRDLAIWLESAGHTLLMLSHQVEALADATSPVNAAGSVGPLQSRKPAEAETR